MKRRLLYILGLLVLSVGATAQIQQGCVKTRGRMVNGKLVPGTMIDHAVVQIKNRNNLVSGKDGTFSFPVSSGKSYILLGARKDGFQMVDVEACREYRPSQTPLYIVMETPERQRADQREAQRKIRDNLNRLLQERETEIERLNIQQAQKDSLIDLLYQQQSDNEKLIADMARRYSEIDYDQLDEYYRQVSYCIEQGQLVKADSLLRSRGDVNQQVEQQLQAGKAIQKEEEKVQHDKAIHSQVNEELARRCYSFYETFAAQHQRDSACHYLEQRARLDTTNLDWLTDVGLYHVYVMAQYDRALEYFQQALRQSLSMDDGKNLGVAVALNNIGLVYAMQDTDYPQALEYLLKGMRIVEELKGTENAEVAFCYSNVSMVFGDMGLNDLSLEYALKALEIREKLQSEDIDQSYNSVGLAYKEKENFPKALEYLQKAYETSKQKRGEKEHHTIDYLNSIGSLYNAMWDLPAALDCYHQVLTVRKEIYDENHPDIGYSYNVIGNVYSRKQDYAQALPYYQKAISVWEKRHDNQTLAIMYQNMAICYQDLGESRQALEFLQKSLKKHGEDSHEVIKIYEQMRQLYLSLQDSARAVDCQEKVAEIKSRYAATGGVSPDRGEANAETIAETAQNLSYHLRTLAILDSIFGSEHNHVADVCSAISRDYGFLRDLQRSEEYQERALSLRKRLNGEHSLKVADSFMDCAMNDVMKGENAKAMDYIEKAKAIKTELLGKDHPDVASVEIWEGMIYVLTEQWEKLIACFRHVLSEKEKTWGPDHIYSTDIIEQLGRAYYELGDYTSALDCFQQSLKIKERYIGPNHTSVLQTKEYVGEVEKEIQKNERIRDLQIITLTPLEEGDSPARQQGLDGKYIILEYCGWHFGEEHVFEKTFNACITQPKDVVLIKDGVITKHHFEEKIGARIKSEDLTKEEKQHIRESYEAWKDNANVSR